MSYANVQVGGYFPAQTRAELAIKNVIGGVLTLLIQAVTPKTDVFMAVERHDAEITARDNDQNEIAKPMALATALQTVVV